MAYTRNLVIAVACSVGAAATGVAATGAYYNYHTDVKVEMVEPTNKETREISRMADDIQAMRAMRENELAERAASRAETKQKICEFWDNCP